MSDFVVRQWCDRHGFERKLDTWKRIYNENAPFPHVVIDGFLPEAVAEEAYRAFPSLDNPVWSEHGSHFTVPGGIARKYELGHKQSFPAAVLQVFDEYLFSHEFLFFVSELTSIPMLFADVEFVAGPRSGGLNAVEKGGTLVRHVDFNFSSELQKYRAVNVLLYLNKGWREQDGGNLALWDAKLKGPPKTVVSSFNRCLIFATNSETYHGYNQVKAESIRKSINLYYFTEDCPYKVDENPHKTDWQPEERAYDNTNKL